MEDRRILEPVWLRRREEKKNDTPIQKYKETNDFFYNEFLGLIQGYSKFSLKKSEIYIHEEYSSDEYSSDENDEYIETELGLSDIDEDLTIINDIGNELDSDQSDSDFEEDL